VKRDFPLAVASEWKKASRAEKPWECLIQAYKFGPFANKNHLSDHLRRKHGKTLPTQTLGRKPKEGTKKKNVNSHRMNARVLTKPFK
jgi:hypothetical protein